VAVAAEILVCNMLSAGAQLLVELAQFVAFALQIILDVLASQLSPPLASFVECFVLLDHGRAATRLLFELTEINRKVGVDKLIEHIAGREVRCAAGDSGVAMCE
jgi:hypothetical protein